MQIVELRAAEHAAASVRIDYVTEHHYRVAGQSEREPYALVLVREPLARRRRVDYRIPLFDVDYPERLAFAVEIDGARCGQLGMHLERRRSRAWINALSVVAPHRGRGLGTKLFARALEVARQHGMRMLVVATQTHNAPAIDFYRERGCHAVGIDLALHTNFDVEHGVATLLFAKLL